MTYSHERAGLLLHITEKIGGHPHLQGIRDMAMAELVDMNKDAAAEFKLMQEDQKKKKQAEAERVQKEIDGRAEKLRFQQENEARYIAQTQAGADKPKPILDPEPKPEHTIERRELITNE